MDHLETNGTASTGPRPAQPGRTYLGDPDVQRMLRVQRGDGRAFAELQHQYAPRVFGYFCRLLRNREEAEDLTQDVFLRLYRSRLNYQPRARFGTWLYHVTQNAARNALRSRSRRAVRLAAAEPSDRPALEGLEADQAAPSTPIERDEEAAVLRSAIAELAGRQRAAVELHLRGHTCAEVAAEMGLTADAVKSLLHRARIRLREALQPSLR